MAQKINMKVIKLPRIWKKKEKTTTNNEQALILLKALLLVVAVWVANPNLDQSLL